MRKSLSKLLLIATIALTAVSCSPLWLFFCRQKNLSPFDFGLASAKTDVERYEVLLKTHKAAVEAGVDVNYKGIDTIKLEIPAKPVRIPLTRYNDFKGCVFVVKNASKSCYLFGYKGEEKPITIHKGLIDARDFRSVNALKQGRYLLVVEDENLWVLNRAGHNYGHSRKDILLVENGVARNAVTMPYNNAYSKPKCSYVELGMDPLVIKNITIDRAQGCTFVANIANISGADNVQISNVTIHTPESELTDDRGISIINCTNVTMDNVRIEGTYSQQDHSGYGLFLNNVWNYNGSRLYGKGNWGVFGNNNVNMAHIKDSQINRFDIHCYGRDISFNNVDFFDLYNQYSSVYGTIQYDKCRFTDFVPVLNGSSYNAYVGYNVVLNNCVFNVSPQKRYLVKMGKMYDAPNERPELAEKCLPNVKIRNLTVNMLDGEENFFIFYGSLSNKNVSSIGYLTSISVDGLTIHHNGERPKINVMLSNVEIGTKSPVDCSFSNVAVTQPQTRNNNVKNNTAVYLKANLPLKGGAVSLSKAADIKYLDK